MHLEHDWSGGTRVKCSSGTSCQTSCVHQRPGLQCKHSNGDRPRRMASKRIHKVGQLCALLAHRLKACSWPVLSLCAWLQEL